MSGVLKMKKRSCEYCKYLPAYGEGAYCRLMDRPIESSILFERGCQHFEEFKQTVFEKITSSEEALAESVVMPITVEYSGDILWVSPLLQKDASKRAIFFDNKSEAIVATVEELKKEAKDEQDL